jgi:hypothetical protein
MNVEIQVIHLGTTWLLYFATFAPTGTCMSLCALTSLLAGAVSQNLSPDAGGLAR